MKIDIDQHFDATPRNVNLVLDNYDLVAEDCEPATTGVENTTLLLTTNMGKFALRIYRQSKKDDAAIENEIAFMTHLRKQSIPVPEVVPDSNGNQLTHTTIVGTTWQAMLMELLEGRRANEYSTALTDNMAGLQARLHTASRTYHPIHQTPPVRILQDQPFANSIDKTALPSQKLVQFLDRARQHKVILPDELQHGWCHLDLDKGNLLVNAQGEITGVLDFDDATDTPFVVDLAYAMWAVCYFGDESLAKRYRARYENTRVLSDTEALYLPEIILFRHYLVSSMFIKNGQHDRTTADRYLAIEQLLIKKAI